MSRWKRIDRGGQPGQLLRHAVDPNRFLIRVGLGVDPRTQTRREYSEVFYGGKKQADARISELLREKYQNRLQKRSDMTVSELADQWLEAKVKISARTLTGYRNSLNTYVLPTLGNMKIRDVTLSDVQGLYNAMSAGTLPPSADEKTGWRGGKLSPATIRQTHAAVNQAFVYAVRNDYISRNPAEHAELPTRDTTERRALTTAELVRFIEATGTSYYGILYRFLAETGVRPGEACAITWPDVNLEDGTIKISKAVTKGPAGERVVSLPKTRSSNRLVFAPPGLLEALRAHHNQQQSLRLDASGHVFVNMDGKPLAPWRLNRRDLPRVLTIAGINPEGVSLYNLRHTFATSLLTSSVGDKVASDLMGHADVKITKNTYQHTDVDMQRAAALQRAAHLEAEAMRLRKEASMSN